MIYTIELVRFIPSRVGVLRQMTHADNDPEVAKERRSVFLWKLGSPMRRTSGS